MDWHSDIEFTYAYLAGFLDADGSISIIRDKRKSKTYHKLTIEAVNQDYRILDIFQDLYRGSIYRKASVWKWTGYGPSMRDLLEDLMPYLIRKKDQAELAVEFLSAIQPRTTYQKKLSGAEMQRREALCTQMNLLNSRTMDDFDQR